MTIRAVGHIICGILALAIALFVYPLLLMRDGVARQNSKSADRTSALPK